MDLLRSEINDFRGGNIKHFFSNWEKITKDKFILDIIKFGLQLEFENGIIPKQKNYPKIKFGVEENNIISNEIEKLLKKRIILPCLREQDDFISSLFTRPKKDGSKRMILNLKQFNQNIIYKHFKMESIKTALECMKKNCYMTSVDLKDAFFSIPMLEAHQKFLKFEHNGKFYKFICMPMGYGPSMRIFTKVLKPVYAHLRGKGLESAVYVDDNILFGNKFEECLYNTKMTVALLRNLGFTVHADKSVFTPTQEIFFLGFVLNSEKMTITLTEEKKQKIKDFCLETIKNPKISIRKLASIIGNLVAALPSVPYGKLFYRKLEVTKILALKKHKGDFDKTLLLTGQAILELKWWSENIIDSFRFISLPPISRIIYTDASNLGWGIHSNGISNGDRWRPEEKDFHINVLELLAIKKGIQSFCQDDQNLHIKVMSDNATAIAYIKNMGGTKSSSCNKVARDIWLWCKSRNIWITIAFVPGKLNIEADVASRKFKENTEWMLNTNVFNSIIEEFGQPEIDLFASSTNRQVDKYVSWKPDPEALVIDAFTIEWKEHFFYIFPPFSILGRVLAKILQEKTKCILITPDWPTQPWYPIMNKLARKRIKFQPGKELLQLPGRQKQHAMADKLCLIASLIH